MLPVIVIAGRPNVGKSTLFNRLVRARKAIVNDEPGVTRDRLEGEASWEGRRFTVVDTGGFEGRCRGLGGQGGGGLVRSGDPALDDARAAADPLDQFPFTFGFGHSFLPGWGCPAAVAAGSTPESIAYIKTICSDI